MVAEQLRRALKLALREAWTTALERWPQLEAYKPQFVERLADLAGVEEGAVKTLLSLRAEDLLLATAALAGSKTAQTKLDALIRATIQPTLRRYLRADDAGVKDVEQNVVVDVLYGSAEGKRAKIAGYCGVGRLSGWLNTVARSTALEYLKTGGKFDNTDFSTREEPINPTPTIDTETEAFAPQVTEALRLAMSELSPKLRTVLRMSELEGLSIDQIGNFYGVHRATAATWIRKAKAEIIARAQEKFRDDAGGGGANGGRIPVSELDGVFWVLSGHVHVSVERMLRDE